MWADGCIAASTVTPRLRVRPSPLLLDAVMTTIKLDESNTRLIARTASTDRLLTVIYASWVSAQMSTIM